MASFCHPVHQHLERQHSTLALQQAEPLLWPWRNVKKISITHCHSVAIVKQAVRGLLIQHMQLFLSLSSRLWSHSNNSAKTHSITRDKHIVRKTVYTRVYKAHLNLVCSNAFRIKRRQTYTLFYMFYMQLLDTCTIFHRHTLILAFHLISAGISADI